MFRVCAGCANRERWLGTTAGLLLLLCAAVRAQSGGSYWDSRFWLPSNIPLRLGADAAGRLVLYGGPLWIFAPQDISLAAWEGRRWVPLGTNVGTVNAIASTMDGVYLGGSFSRQGGTATTNVAFHNGSDWQALGTGLPGSVSALLPGEAALIAGGSFTNSVTGLTNVARWEGQQWHPMGGGVPGTVLALAQGASGTVYAGSDGVSNAVPASVWEWTGQDWIQIGQFGEPNARRLRDLAYRGGTLFAGLAPADGTNCVMQWQGNAWSAAGDVPLAGRVEAMAIHDDELVVAGVLSWVRDGITNAAGVVRLADGWWEPELAEETISAVDVVSGGSDLYVIGRIRDGAIGGGGRGLWHYDGATWGQLNNGLAVLSQVYRMVRIGSHLVITAAAAAPQFRPGLAWDGRDWRQLGVAPPTGSTLRIVRELGTVGGDAFIDAILNSGTPGATGIVARLEGTNWVQATGPLPLTTVTVITGDPHRQLYVAGTRTGAPKTGAVLKWDGSEWVALGGPFTGPGTAQTILMIDALVIPAGTPYVGGSFTNIAGADIRRFARWNDPVWEAVGEPLDAAISAMAVSAQGIYVAGSFTNAGSIRLNGVGLWESNTWNSLGGGFEGKRATALAVSGDGLVAVGTLRGGLQEIWIWRGTNWALAGVTTGITSPINRLLWHGHDLYVAGSFSTAGPYASCAIAIWHEEGPWAELVQNTAGGFGVRFTGALPRSFILEGSLDLVGWESVGTNRPATPEAVIGDPGSAALPRGFYRLNGP